MPYFDEYAGFDQNMREDDKETPPPSPAPQKSNETSAAHTIFDYAEMLILTVVFVLLATTLLFRHTVVMGESMVPTLENGQHLIISNVFYTPRYGDIVVIESEDETGINTPIIKRVIATEGQTVSIRADGIYVDNEPLNEPYVNENAVNKYLSYNESNRLNTLNGKESIYKDYMTQAKNEDGSYTYVVGENEVFVLGDNRFNSTDSRMFGPVNKNCILGRVILRLTPLKKFGGVK